MICRELQLSPLSELALYIHIPFCDVKCDYCAFFSATEQSDHLHQQYIEALIHQFDRLYDSLGRPFFKTIYIGGGTPVCIGANRLRQLLSHLAKASPQCPLEWTVEVNPGVVTQEHIELFQEFGINRLSVGVQSFNPDVRRTLGRGPAHLSSEQLLSQLEDIRYRWKDRLSIDLITAVPGQTLSDALKDLDDFLTLDIDHLSLYTLIWEEGTPLFQKRESRLIKPVSEELEEDIWLQSCAKLRSAGFEHYEVSNFARNNQYSLHNLQYWRLNPYLGLGPGAASTLPSESGIIRLSHKTDLNEYLSDSACHGIETELISPRDFCLEHFMMGLRTSEGIDRSVFRHRFGHDPVDLLPVTTSKWQNTGLLRLTSERYRLSQEGRNLLNSFLIEAMDEIPSIDNAHWP